MKKTTILFLVSLPAIVLAGVVVDEAYEPKGPTETAGLETALRKRLGVYVEGIWPRAEVLAGATRGKQLPEKDVQRLQAWLRRIVKKSLVPERVDPNAWYGVRRLHFNQDYIIGQFPTSPQGITLQFQANGVGLTLTGASASFFPNGVAGISDAEIIKAITGLVNYPEDMVPSIALEKKVEQMGETNKEVSVCYGKLRSGGYDPMRSPYHSPPPENELKNVPTWWNHMTFWMTKGRVFISTTMVNWETMPSTTAPFIFRLDSREKPKK